MMQLDHLAVAGETLEEARQFVEDALGVEMQKGGQHAVFHTHNMLLGLEGGLYLEAIAIDPAASPPARPRWFDLDRFKGGPRLTNWICRTDDMEMSLRQLPDGMGDPVALQRGDLRWRMAVPASGILPYDNCAPAVIAWDTKRHPARSLPPSGVNLRKLTVRHPDIARLQADLRPFFDDARVQFVKGAAGLCAEFDTPTGEKVLER